MRTIFRGNHPYIAAVKDLATMTIQRLSMPILLIDWIFYLTPYGRTFRKAADTVHTLAEEVRERAIKNIVCLQLIVTSQIISSRREQLHQKKEVKECEGGKKVLDFLDILLETKVGKTYIKNYLVSIKFVNMIVQYDCSVCKQW